MLSKDNEQRVLYSGAEFETAVKTAPRGQSVGSPLSNTFLEKRSKKCSSHFSGSAEIIQTHQLYSTQEARPAEEGLR